MRDFSVTHKFAVGQIVDVTVMKFRPAAIGDYQILRLMPVEDNVPVDPAYRIKNIAENYERVVRESELTLSERSIPLSPSTAFQREL